MVLLRAAVAGGVTFMAWKSVTPTTKWVMLTFLVSLVYNDVIFSDDEFGLPDLAIAAIVSGGVMGAR